MKTKTSIVLSSMMFLQYYIWGSWYVTMGTFMSKYLGSSGLQIGAAYSALAIATMISPFFVGMIADRFFSAQKVMGVLHIIGGILLFVASKITTNGAFYWIILFYPLADMPTMALTNSVVVRQMTDIGKQFPPVRVFGTVGWVISGFMISIFGIEQTPMTFYMAAIVSGFLGVYSFFLPATPPVKTTATTTAKAIFVIYSLILFKDKSYLIFFIAAIFVCIPLSFYFSFANLYLNQLGMSNVAGKMVLGQISEALFILVIPFFFNRIGVKKMLLIGMSAWIMRYLCFAFGNIDLIWLLYTGIILHGVCYDFFFVTGYMYTEKKSNDKIKSASQGLFTFVTYGLGMFFGTWFAGFVARYYSVGQDYQWQNIWLTPAFIAVAVLVCFIFFFNEKKDIQ
jgi:nucleoside transporter